VQKHLQREEYEVIHSGPGLRPATDRTNADIDPEDDSHRPQDSDYSDDEEDSPASAGREHYESMGESHLRKPEQPLLGKKYGGVAVSREDLHDSDNDHDPFAQVEEDGDEDPFAGQGTASDESVTSDDVDAALDPENASLQGSADSPSEDDTDAQDSESEGSYDDDALSDGRTDEQSFDDSADEGKDYQSLSKPLTNREKLKALSTATTAESAVVSSLSTSAQDQARKGAAVKQQQSAHDRLLGARIKLQKAVHVANDLDTFSTTQIELKNAAAKAEAAALSLWSTIDSIRCDVLNQLQSTQSSTKRKIEALDPSPSTSLPTLHSHTQALEAAALPHRQSTLNHWYARTRPATIPSASHSALSNDTSTISTVLTTYLHTTQPKLVAAATPSPGVYDDTPFYQSLLTSLIASRSNAVSLPSTLPSTLPASSSRNPKIKNHVDTKASKGRKIRYTVHDKLLNFMAPEDRSTWTDEGRREFFGSLLGRLVDHARDQGGEIEEAEQEAEASLRLFRQPVTKV
jgi:protein AATF/BFR2